jgi:hypothetical protein
MDSESNRGMFITRISPVTGETRTLEIMCSKADYEAWERGALIQNVMGYLSPADREYIMTGATQEDWDKLFGEMEDDDVRMES